MTNPPGAMPPLPDLRQFHNSVDGVIELVMKRYGQACAEAAAAPLIARVAELQAERDRIERNRDMWKGQCERQAERLTVFHVTVPALEKDAARFQGLIRTLDWDGHGYWLPELCIRSRDFGEDFVPEPSIEELRTVIDAAIAAKD